MLGVIPVLCENDTAITRLPIKESLHNSRQQIHGGAILSVFDFTLSAAARSIDPVGYGMATISMSTNFIEPGDGDMTVEARCVRRGGSIAFCEAVARDDSGKIVATASGAFKIIKVSK
jgi:uncharacterized protein (TIGR00369 family)